MSAAVAAVVGGDNHHAVPFYSRFGNGPTQNTQGSVLIGKCAFLLFATPAKPVARVVGIGKVDKRQVGLVGQNKFCSGFGDH